MTEAEVWEVVRSNQSKTAEHGQILNAQKERLDRIEKTNEKNSEKLFDKLSEVLVSIKGIQTTTTHLSDSVRAVEENIEKRKDQTGKDLENLVKVVVAEHQRTCAGQVKKPLTKVQLAGYGTLFTTIITALCTAIIMIIQALQNTPVN